MIQIKVVLKVKIHKIYCKVLIIFNLQILKKIKNKVMINQTILLYQKIAKQ